jgi:leucyl-tRNA synthetase
MNGYNHKDIEQKWQKVWQDTELYRTPDKIAGKENFYLLVEFSYPSGNLHVGHWYTFAVPDIYARYKRMQGFNVLYPTGFDAFGLPAENAAIKLGADPKVWTYEQMEKMRTQLRSMGAMFDWSREVVTCDPAYYKWTQWMFNKFLEHDLVYRDTTQVNWCPKDQTILANEQVVDGKCERCGTEVVQREQPQWMLRITRYADQLIEDLHELDWPHAIKEAQKNWIGRSEGSEIDFRIGNSDEKIRIFTTRADTIMGVTYLAIAPEHSLMSVLLEKVTNKDEVLAYIESAKKKSELDRQQSKEKTGVVLAGVTVVNPANNEELPVWVADYVLAGYGTGAVMGVPQHDERDHAFATTHGLRIVDQPLVEKDIITQKVGGKFVKTYRLRDWGISRQRYWGCPIPIVYDPEGKAHPVPDEHLPWLLPTDVDHTPDGTAPLARSRELVERTEKIFGKGWKPEVETMDAFVDSTWYFYRYLDHANEVAFADKEKMAAWMPVDLYMGGAEHTTMHVLYSRFWTKALHDLGFVTDKEAFVKRRNRGLILGPDGNKMSKSKGNVINPDEIVDRLGTDTVRMYLAFMGPYNTPVNYPWDPNGVVGVRRFLERVWKLKEKLGETDTVTTTLHKTIQKMSDDMQEYKFNTSISAMMILVNEWEKAPLISVSEYKTLLQLLAPFAPHMAEELWHVCGENGSIHHTQWPVADASLLVDDSYTIGVQINGKLRTELTAPTSATKEDLETMARALPRVVELTSGVDIKQVIVVPGRIINIVI